MAKTSTALRVSTFVINAFWRSLRAVNLFLFLLATIQCLIIALLLADLKISLPTWCSDVLRKEISKVGFDVNFSDVTVDLRGNVSANSVRARFNSTPRDFFTAEKISVSLWLPRLLGGELALRSVRVTDARLDPAHSDVHDSNVVDSLFADILIEGSWVRLKTFSARVGKLYFHASGYIDMNFNSGALFDGIFADNSSKPKTEVKPFDSSDFAKKWDEALGNYPKIKNVVDKLSDPMLDVSFLLYGEGEGLAKLTFVSSGISFPVKDSVADLGNIEAKVRFDNRTGKQTMVAKLFAEKFFLKDYPSFENISVHSDIVLSKGYVALENLEADINNIDYDGSRIGSVRLRKDILNAENIVGEWVFFLTQRSHKFAGTVELSKDFDAKVEFAGRLDVDLALERKELADISELKELRFPKGLEVEGSGEFSSDFKRARAELNFETENCLIMNIPVKLASGSVDYSSDDSVLNAKNLHLETVEGWIADGEYIQNFETNGYIVRASGNLRPMAIAGFMEEWWTRVMKDFIFLGDSNFPKADVFVEGTWGAPENIWCFTRASGKDAEYRDSRFTDFSLNVLVTPKRISLYDVYIKSLSGEAVAAIDWLYGADGLTTFQEQKIYMDSTLSSAEIIAFGGDDAKEVLDVVRFDNPPKLIFNASMRNPSNNPKNLPDIFNATVNSNGITRIEMAVLDNFIFTASSDKIHTELKDVLADFCGGKVEGLVDLKRISKGMEFDAKLNASEMNQLRFTEFLMSLGSGDKTKDTVPEDLSKKENDKKKKESLVDGGENGSIIMTINLRGDTANFEKCTGAGYAVLENKDLVKLNLFGMLSRTLAAVKLPLGSFDVTLARGEFEISDGIVKFPNLEFGGPVMLIKGAANYNFIKDNLDASLIVAPFGGLTTPLVSSVVSLITPLTNTVQVNLNGELSAPKMGVSVKPSNIIRSEERITEKIRDEL